MSDHDIQLAPMYRLIKKGGADRVSDEACVALRDALEEIGVRITREALDFTHHTGRKTIKAEDIEIAVRKILK